MHAPCTCCLTTELGWDTGLSMLYLGKHPGHWSSGSLSGKQKLEVYYVHVPPYSPPVGQEVFSTCEVTEWSYPKLGCAQVLLL